MPHLCIDLDVPANKALYIKAKLLREEPPPHSEPTALEILLVFLLAVLNWNNATISTICTVFVAGLLGALFENHKQQERRSACLSLFNKAYLVPSPPRFPTRYRPARRVWA